MMTNPERRFTEPGDGLGALRGLFNAIKMMGAVTGAAVCVALFALTCARDPLAAFAGLSLVLIAWAGFWHGSKDESLGYRVASRVIALWMLAMAGMTWGVW